MKYAKHAVLSGVISALVGSAALASGALPTLLDCEKPDTQNAICKRVAELGRFERAIEGPKVAARATTEVFYEPTWGSNIRQESVALLQRRGDGLGVLWTHTALDLSSRPLVPLDDARVFHWRFAPNGERIFVSGNRTTGVIQDMRTGRSTGQNRPLAAEVYCYERDAAIFRLCR